MVALGGVCGFRQLTAWFPALSCKEEDTNHLPGLNKVMYIKQNRTNSFTEMQLRHFQSLVLFIYLYYYIFPSAN